jgi:segregation and condensation protein B
MGRPPKSREAFDRELADLPPELRRRQFLGRIEAVLFAAPAPVRRETLLRVIGGDDALEDLIDALRDELAGRACELVNVAGGWQLRTRPMFADAVHAAAGVPESTELSHTEALILTAIAYFQPVTRAELSQIFARPVSRDVIARLRATKFVASGPRSPRPGAPFTYVTTEHYLTQFGLDSLRDLPDMDRLEEAGLLSKESLLNGELATLFGIEPEEEESIGVRDRQCD